MNNYDKSSSGIDIETNIQLVEHFLLEDDFVRVADGKYLYVSDGELSEEIQIDQPKDYLIYTSKGYSQGDVVKILVNTKEYETVYGSKFKIEDHKQAFDNVFWDCWMNVEIQINGIKFVGKLHQEFDNCGTETEYNKIEVIDDFVEQYGLEKSKLRTELEKLVPEKIDFLRRV